MTNGADDRHRTDSRTLLMLWAGVLLAPAAWIVHQQGSYYLVYWACRSGHMFVLHLWSAAMFLVAATGGYFAYRSWNRSGGGSPGEGGAAADRSRFLGLGGMIAGGLFALVILAQWTPMLLVDPCVR